MTTIETVHLDDLAEPRFSADIDAIRSVMADMGADLRLDPDAMIEAARAQEGLDDLGGDGWREGYGVLVSALQDEAGLSPQGVLSLHTQIVQFLANRLRLAALVAEHPEILDVEIAAPIVIAGLPRTGTTHLHNLLAADPALRTLPYWESLEPIPPASERGTDHDPAGRMARTAVGVDFLDAALPHFKRMHEMTVEHVHEEIGLLAMSFSTMFFETLANMPSYREWYRATSQRAAYRELRTYLQAMTWLRGGERWVLKSPQHLEQFGVLLDVFPDATVVVTHRDPVSVTASMATMVTYLRRTQVDHPDPVATGGYWFDRVEDLLTSCLDDREVLAPDRSIDVRFADFMGDMTGTVAQIYEVAGQPLTQAARAAHEGYLAGHGRDRFGRIDYRLEDFGITVDACRARFAPYVERFAVQQESAITR